jgi:Flp pilus assembly protein CpaB
LVAASVATGIFYGLIGSKLRDVTTGTPRQPIIVAVRNLERGTMVKATDVKVSTWGGAEPLKGGYTAVEQVAGKTIDSAVQENEPITQARLVARDGGVGVSIASGMRAVSVHASDSSGVVNLLRPGDKVDVQVMSERHGEGLKLRTTVQNLEVLAIQPPESNGGRPAAPVVTLLVTPAAADHLGLADSGARIRLLLRNPLDRGEDSRPGLTLENVFADGNDLRMTRGDRSWEAVATVRPATQAASQAAPQARPRFRVHAGGVPGKVHLLVQIAGAQPEAIDELAAKLHWPRRTNTLQVVPLPPGKKSEQMVRALEVSQGIAVLSSTELSTRSHHPVSMQTGATWGAPPGAPASEFCGLRIRFLPVRGRRGSLRVRVQLAMTASRSAGVAARKMETGVDLADGQSFLVAGFSDAGDWPVLSERLFGGRPKEDVNRELVVIVTPRVLKPNDAAALAARR